MSRAPAPLQLRNPAAPPNPADECLPFGLDRQKLDDSSELHVPRETPLYVAYLSGKSVYGLVPRSDGSLLAQSLLCDKNYTSCTRAFQVWEPASPDAAVRVLAH